VKKRKKCSLSFFRGGLFCFALDIGWQHIHYSRFCLPPTLLYSPISYTYTPEMVDRQTGCRVHYDYFSLAWARQKTKRNLNVGHLSVYGFGVFLLPFFHFQFSPEPVLLFFFNYFFLFFWIGRKQSNVQHAIELTRETNHSCMGKRNE